MKYISENLFDLVDSQEFACHVLSFLRPHKQLVIAAYHLSTEEEHYFNFPFLRYFEGPSVWRGANFRVATKNELAKLLPKLDLDVEVFVNGYDLFVVETLTGFKVKIVAANPSEIPKPSTVASLKE